MSYSIQCPECKAEWIPLDKVSPEFKFNLLKAENSRLREALKVYADLEYWGAVQGDDQEYLFRESIGQKTYVQGKRARAALEGKG